MGGGGGGGGGGAVPVSTCLRSSIAPEKRPSKVPSLSPALSLIISYKLQLFSPEIPD